MGRKKKSSLEISFFLVSKGLYEKYGFVHMTPPDGVRFSHLVGKVQSGNGDG